MYFTANGRALPCCIAPFSMHGYDSFTLGDATQQTLREIWNGPQYQQFRGSLMGPEPPPRLRQLRSPLEPVVGVDDYPHQHHHPRAQRRADHRRGCPRASRLHSPSLRSLGKFLSSTTAAPTIRPLAPPKAEPLSSTPRYAATAAPAIPECLPPNPESSVFVFLDGDGSDVTSELPAIANPVLEGRYDFVIGSRILGQREPGSLLPSQIFAGRFAGILIRLRYGVRYTDMGPFRAISRTALESLKMSEMTYGWNLEMQMKAARDGLRIVEVQLLPPPPGRSLQSRRVPPGID